MESDSPKARVSGFDLKAASVRSNFVKRVLKAEKPVARWRQHTGFYTQTQNKRYEEFTKGATMKTTERQFGFIFTLVRM